MRILIQHETKYEYERPVYLTPHILRLKPAAHCPMPIENFSLSIEPENYFIHSLQDAFGNFLTRVDFKGPLQELVIKVQIIANIIPTNPFDFFIDETAQYFPFEYEPLMKKGITPYLEITDNGPEFRKWIEKIDRSKQETVDFLIKLNREVYQDISYTIRMEHGVQTCETSLSKRSGSCRDSAWLLVQVLRQLGLAARLVSGYLVQVKAEKCTDHLQEDQEHAAACQEDTAAFHAWAEVYVPGAGWLGLDPTSGQFAGEGHIPLACTPHPDSAAPITGTSEICKTIFTHNNTISSLDRH